MANILEQLGVGGINFGFSNNLLNTTINGIIYVFIAGIILGFIFWYLNNKKYNIQIIGHDKRGDSEFTFFDLAKEIITANRAELKLKKRKKANVIIPDLRLYRSMVDGRRKIEIFKYGAVNDYVVLNPRIVIEAEQVQVLDKDGNPELDETGKPIILEVPKYNLEVTESLSNEHSVKDLREIWNRFTREEFFQKYQGVIMTIIVGISLIIMGFIIGKYQLSASVNFQQGAEALARAVTKTADVIAQQGQIVG